MSYSRGHGGQQQANPGSSARSLVLHFCWWAAGMTSFQQRGCQLPAVMLACSAYIIIALFANYHFNSCPLIESKLATNFKISWKFASCSSNSATSMRLFSSLRFERGCFCIYDFRSAELLSTMGCRGKHKVPRTLQLPAAAFWHVISCAAAHVCRCRAENQQRARHISAGNVLIVGPVHVSRALAKQLNS